MGARLAGATALGQHSRRHCALGVEKGNGAGHPPTSRSGPPRRLLELLSERKVKRIVLLSDGRTAIVEVPVENTETNFNTMRYNRRLDFK